jgi:hypothetical protein
MVAIGIAQTSDQPARLPDMAEGRVGTVLPFWLGGRDQHRRAGEHAASRTRSAAM